MPAELFKVAPPRPDMVFVPTAFWHSVDWSSSTTKPRDGYIEDRLLFVGDFDEVSIHLFPRVRTLRLFAAEAELVDLGRWGIPTPTSRTALVVAERRHRVEVETFEPTVFTFDPAGFTHIRRGEYVSWQPQMALSSETLSIHAALERWNVDACFVESLDDLIAVLSTVGVYYEVQT